MLGAFADDGHIRRGRAHVRASRVAARKGRDDLAYVPERVSPPRLAERGTVRHGHYGFPAAIGEPGDRELAGHASRKTQGIVEPGPPIGVTPDPAAADRLAE